MFTFSRLRFVRLVNILSLSLFVFLGACENMQIKGQHWWRFTSDRKAIDIIYRSYCTPDPSTCMPMAEYENIGVIRKTDRFIIGFEHMNGQKLIAFTCQAKKDHLNCIGSGRGSGSDRRMDYPINWDDNK